jgi:paraquat-inducible protein A
MMDLKACHCCGRIHQVPALEIGQSAACTRCGSTMSKPGATESSVGRTAALTLGAFCLFWPAVLLPILQIERLGHRSASSVLGGTIDLLAHGNWLVGGVVLLFSIVFPLLKLVLLLELCLLRLMHAKHRAMTYHIVEHAGKWSMMDVMLLAFLVMLVKLGNLVQFQFGPAVIAFVGCVTFSMLASMSFDPHSIWSEDE